MKTLVKFIDLIYNGDFVELFRLFYEIILVKIILRTFYG